MVDQAQYLSGTNQIGDHKMFAIIEKETNNVVFSAFANSESDFYTDKDAADYYVIEMTEENSPAHVPGKYLDGKFHRGYMVGNQVYLIEETE